MCIGEDAEPGRWAQTTAARLQNSLSDEPLAAVTPLQRDVNPAWLVPYAFFIFVAKDPSKTLDYEDFLASGSEVSCLHPVCLKGHVVI